MKTTTNYAIRYKGMMEKGLRVSKGDIQPYGIYKISTYTSAEGIRTTLKADEETLIFVTGIYQFKIHALKLSNIEPVKFLNWVKKLPKGNDDTLEEKKQSNVPLYEIATPLDKSGNKVYTSYITSMPAFLEKGAAYRTYNIKGIQHATEFYLKPNVLKQYYGY